MNTDKFHTCVLANSINVPSEPFSESNIQQTLSSSWQSRSVKFLAPAASIDVLTYFLKFVTFDIKL